MVSDCKNSRQGIRWSWGQDPSQTAFPHPFAGPPDAAVTGSDPSELCKPLSVQVYLPCSVQRRCDHWGPQSKLEQSHPVDLHWLLQSCLSLAAPLLQVPVETESNLDKGPKSEISNRCFDSWLTDLPLKNIDLACWNESKEMVAWTQNSCF